MPRARANSTPRRRHLLAALEGLGADPGPADGQAADWRWRRCPGCGVTFLGAQERCMACREGLTVVREEDEEGAARPVLTREALLARAGKTVGEVMAEFRSSGRYIRARAQEWGVEIVDGVIQPERTAEAPKETWPVSPERLKQLYLDERVPIKEIARRFGVTRSQVTNTLNKYGLWRKFADVPQQPTADLSARRVGQEAARLNRLLLTVRDRVPPERARLLLQGAADMVGASPAVGPVDIELRIEAQLGEASGA